MRRYVQPAIWLVLFGAAVCLGGKLIRTCRSTETGFESVRAQWSDATLGIFSESDGSIASREPREQARFWLAETERVLADTSPDANVLIGAALVLDSPGSDFMGKYLRRIDRLGGMSFPEIDRDGIERAELSFEELCRKRCLDLAAQATELESDQVEWWRLRAILLFRTSLYSADDAPREERWMEVLAECEKHDPENALYDYLAANQLWEESADVEFADYVARLVIKDEERFEQGIQRFAEGQKKAVLTINDAGYTATAAFLERSRLPQASHPGIINSRSVHFRRGSLLTSLWRWQDDRAEQAAHFGNLQEALKLHHQNLILIAQYTNDGATTAFESLPVACQASTAFSMSVLADSQAVLERDDFAVVHRDALVRRKVIEGAGRALAKGKPQQRGSGLTIFGDAAWALKVYFAENAPSLLTLLLVMGTGITIALGWSGRKEVPHVGPVGHLLAMAIALVATIVLFGLAPARMISHEVQAWSLSFLLIITPILFVSWIGWIWLRRRHFKISLRAMLMVVFVFCLVFGVISIAHTEKDAFSDFPFNLAIPAQGLEGLGTDPASLHREFEAKNALWYWALCQWAAYYGHYVCLATWAGLVAVISWRKTSKLRDDDRNSPTLPMLGILRSLHQPSFVLAALLFLAYLVVMPEVVVTTEEVFQENIAFARRPASHWEKVQQAVHEIETDDQKMQTIRQQAEAEALRWMKEEEAERRIQEEWIQEGEIMGEGVLLEMENE